MSEVNLVHIIRVIQSIEDFVTQKSGPKYKTGEASRDVYWQVLLAGRGSQDYINLRKEFFVNLRETPSSRSKKPATYLLS